MSLHLAFKACYSFHLGAFLLNAMIYAFPLIVQQGEVVVIKQRDFLEILASNVIVTFLLNFKI
jgi:hypothetical protein